jgi:peptide/nickel transport system permease protein
VTSIAIAWLIAVPLGIRSARRAGTLEDNLTTNSLFMLWSLPSFFIGTLLLHYFCTSTPASPAWFPNKGLSSDGSLWYTTPHWLGDLLWHGFLPLVTLSYASFVSLSRYLRGNLLEHLSADYVRTARAKGVSEDDLVYRHALRNSSLTLITLSSSLLAELFSGVLIVEMIFSIPGLGWLLLDAARQQDGPLIMASTVVSVGLLLVGILVADILYAVVDPRIRSRYG